MTSLAEIEDLLIASINAGLILRACKTYSGELEGDITQLVLRTPAVLMAYARSDYNAEVSGYSQDVLVHQWDLLVVCRNLRGDDAARRESGGIYDILSGLKNTLLGVTLADDLMPIEFRGEEAHFITKEVAVYAASYIIPQVMGR